MHYPPFPYEARETDRLREPQIHHHLDTPSEPAFDDTVCLAQSLFDVATSTVSLIDIERQWFKARAGLDVSATVRAEAFCAQAITGSDVLTILDAAINERFASNPLVTGAPYIRFYAGAPLVTPTGATIGTLCIFDPVSRGRSRDPVSRGRSRNAKDCCGLGMLQTAYRKSRVGAISGAATRLRG